MRVPSVVIVAISIAMLTLAPPTAVAQSVIEIEPTELAITLTGEETTVLRIPYTEVEGIPADGLAIDDVSARRDGTPTTLVPDAITFTPDPSTKTILITIKNGAFVRAGVYTVSARVAAGDVVHVIGLTLTRPSAIVELPTETAIKIEQTVVFPELDFEIEGLDDLFDSDGAGSSRTDPPIVLRIGDETRLLELTARPLGTDDNYVTLVSTGSDSTDAGPAVAAQLLGSPATAGDLIDLSASLHGDFPLGVTQRTVRLESPQLEQPIDVRVEVTKRRTRLLIPLVIVMGLVLGYLARTLPARYQRRSAAAARLRWIELQLRGLENHPDDGVAKMAATQLAVIDGVKPSDPHADSKIDAAITAANSELERVSQAIAALESRLAGLEAVVSRGWVLPARTAEHLAAVETVLGNARRHAGEGNPTGMETELEDAELALEEQLDTTTKGDADAIKRLALDAQNALTGFTDSGVRQATASLAQVAEVAATPLGTDQPAPGRIEWLHNLSFRAEHAATQLADAIEALASESNDDSARALSAWIVGRLRSGGFHKLPIVTPRLADLRAQLNDDVALGGPRSAVESAPTATAVVAPTPALIAAAGSAPWYRRVAANADEVQWRTFGRFVELGRYLALLVVLLIVSYGWFADDWYGTLKDVSTILVWAFGIDLTVELVTQTAATNPASLAIAAAAGSPPPPASAPAIAGGSQPEPVDPPAPEPADEPIDEPPAEEAHEPIEEPALEPAEEPAEEEAAGLLRNQSEPTAEPTDEERL